MPLTCKRVETLHFGLKTCVLPSRPGSVGYYVAIGEQADDSATNVSPDQPKSTMILGIRGTSTLEELLTDACGRSVSYEGPNRYAEDSGEGIGNSIRIEVVAREVDQVCFGSEFDRVGDEWEGEVEVVSGHERVCVEQDGNQLDEHLGDSKHLPGRPLLRRSSNLDSQIRCHEGILISARRLFWQVRPIVEEKIVRGSSACYCWPQFGASAGCLLALMLRSMYPELIQADRLHVYAFGPPPVLDYDSAIGASTYVTSIVHQSDLISRCSLANLTVFLEFLRTVSSEVLVAQDLAPSNPRAAGALLMQLSKGDKVSRSGPNKILPTPWLRHGIKVAMRDPDHLYVPGKVLLLESTGTSILSKTCRILLLSDPGGTTACN
ncbi:lipase [Fragilaria crotonensis]|nr:lipase [Fragilaria crotonensis]